MNLRPASNRLCFGLAITCLVLDAAAVLAKPGIQQTAKQLDRLIAEEVFPDDAKPAPIVGDATYLRRVWLDIVGDIPTPEHVTAFLLDPAPDKREAVVRDLLANPQYGQNWARYWRDVILYRKLEDRAGIVSNPLVVALTERLNDNVPWNTIAAEFVTASGDIREEGMTAIHAAQDARTEETAAEMSRIFLGIQIQCCQCHDHPYDHWKREQFHGFAAFFPRLAMRPVVTPTRRSFTVVADDFGSPRQPRPDDQGRRGQQEHFMPDLDDPAAPGTRMQPKFFLTSAEMPFGTLDAERRETIAQWMTGNPWFATAFVNRIWSELVGEGFYEPIDDIGPDRTPTAPKAVAQLSRGFEQSGYDVKWLLSVICATEAYQRECRPRRDPDAPAFLANVAQPLRSDQLFNAILSAVDIEEPELYSGRRGRPAGGMGPYGNRSIRASFEDVFGYDPSDPRDSVVSSIPQALAMMNGTRLNLAIRAIQQETVLGKLLAEIPDDKLLIQELYLRTLSREPTRNELNTALAFCRSSAVTASPLKRTGKSRASLASAQNRLTNSSYATKDRSEVFEDLFWALLNSSEFSHRR